MPCLKCAARATSKTATLAGPICCGPSLISTAGRRRWQLRRSGSSAASSGRSSAGGRWRLAPAQTRHVRPGRAAHQIAETHRQSLVRVVTTMLIPQVLPAHDRVRVPLPAPVVPAEQAVLVSVGRTLLVLQVEQLQGDVWPPQLAMDLDPLGQRAGLSGAPRRTRTGDLAVDFVALHDVDVLVRVGRQGVMAATDLDEHAPTPYLNLARQACACTKPG